MQSPFKPALLVFILLFGNLVQVTLTAATFPPRGDDITTSLGQFKIVVDPHWEAAINSNPAYQPYLKNSGGHLSFTSPVLFDPTTTIGRSDPLLLGSPEDATGVIAGDLDPHKITEGQLTVKPALPDSPAGTREVHTFIEALHLSGLGFEVKAGKNAPLRPACPGQVESLSGASGDPTQDFPAKSFFNVFVEVTIPGLGGFPPIQLANTDPLLVQNTNVTTFPPNVVYFHGNSSAVSMFFNTDIPQFGIQRGDLFGQLTLAGHGVGKQQSEAEAFQAEVETETELQLQSNPLEHVTVVDQRIFELQFLNTRTTNTIRFPGRSGERYALQFAPFLSVPMQWQDVSTNKADSDQTLEFNDVRDNSVGFYRARNL